MKITKSMLKKWVNVQEDLFDITNKHIIEVDAYEKQIVATNLTIGKVLTCIDHPNSDHLHITTVDLKTHVEQIVCGAPNVQAGQYVIVAKTGAVLPGGFVIKPTKIRGIESNGMICSLKELGIDERLIEEKHQQGIYVFEEEVSVGEDPLEVLGFKDEVMTLGLTPNRSDLLSVLGFAYDYAAMTNQVVKEKTIEIVETNHQNPLKIELKTDQVMQYHARYIESVTIKESPLWLKQFLVLQDIQPINNVVDITNYILMMYGTPLHAFDAELFETNQIIVEVANKKQEVTTLDQEVRMVHQGDILITNGQKPVALGGVMGLLNTAIHQGTKKVILEAAQFDPIQIARTSKEQQLRSDASLRFERGIDSNRVLLGLEQATALLIELADAKISKGIVSKVNKLDQTKPILISRQEINRHLGITLSREALEKIFDAYQYKVQYSEDVYHITVPSYRRDLKIPADLYEEVARYYGLDEIKNKPLTKVTKGHLTTQQKTIRNMRHYLANQGLNEAITYSLQPVQQVLDFGTIGEKVEILKPLSEDRKALRQSLILGLLKVAQYNQARQHEEVALFEIGHVFANQIEENHLSIVISGDMYMQKWSNQSVVSSFYVLKGILESLLETMGQEAVLNSAELSNFHPYQAAYIVVEGKEIGYMGRIHPKKEKEMNLKPTYALEINLDALHAKEIQQYQPLLKYPTVERDLAFVVQEQIPVGDIVSLIKQTIRKNILKVVVFDIYQHASLGENLKSVAVNLVLFDEQKTLTSEEVDKMIKKVSSRLIFEYQAKIRD